MKKVIIFDTSILCCWLQVHRKETCGPAEDQWDHDRVKSYIQACQGATFVLPLAAIIETGNHISQASAQRHECAIKLCELIKKAAAENEPWAAFNHQDHLWGKEHLLNLVEQWPEMASRKLSLGDSTIIKVAEFYSNIGFDVQILTGDEGLKSYSPLIHPLTPRRRRI
ncbi:hypothetical protein [Chromobacterium vaccinii]|uniref:hypothetical protein n=1 Tax=Chromobacterium vaccinii TaxID=1108595 RepID=UPI0009E4E08E|nr:hypothetical protein [Chromobacterium vaccinii]